MGEEGKSQTFERRQLPNPVLCTMYFVPMSLLAGERANQVCISRSIVERQQLSDLRSQKIWKGWVIYAANQTKHVQ